MRGKIHCLLVQNINARSAPSSGLSATFSPLPGGEGTWKTLTLKVTLKVTQFVPRVVQPLAGGVGFLVICLRLRIAVKRIMIDNLCMGAYSSANSPFSVTINRLRPP